MRITRSDIVTGARRALLAVLLCACQSLQAAPVAEDIYQSVDAFLDAHFPQAPEMGTLWLSDEQRAVLRERADDDPGFRVRYWRQGARSAWVLNVIGRDHPITVGAVVGPAGVEDMTVLVYRESRGWEVRHDFFTRQFDGATLQPRGLDKSIDNITGATLSVRAMKRAAIMALILHQQLEKS